MHHLRRPMQQYLRRLTRHQTKTAVIADLQKSAAEAKNTIDNLKEEVRRLRQQNNNAADEPQRADTTANRVTTNHLVTIIVGMK